MLAYRHWYGSEEEKRYYIYGDALGQKGKSACVQGEVDRLEQKQSSCQLYLTNVTVQLEQDSDKSWLSNLVVSLEKKPDVLPGYRMQITGTLSDFSRASNPGQFDSKTYYREQGIYYRMYGKEWKVSAAKPNIWKARLFTLRENMLQVISRCLPTEQAGIVKTMLFGEKSSLDPELRQLYQQNGIGHLLAISGLHISILCMGLYRFLLCVRLPRSCAIPLTILCLYCYGEMAGFGIATTRAVVMMILFLTAQWFGRSYDLLSALSLSALITLLQKPFALTSCSFLLSYLAILGIALVFPVMRDAVWGDAAKQRERARKMHRKEKECRARGGIGQLVWLSLRGREILLQAFLFNVSIQIATLPVVLWFYFEIPTYSIFLNLLVLPLASGLLILAMGSTLLGLVSLTAAKFLFGSVYDILQCYEMLCLLFSRLPCSVFVPGRPDLIRVFCYIAVMVTALVLAYFFPKSRRFFFLSFSALFFLLIPRIQMGLSVTFLDVGQGDGIVLETPEQTILVDGGSTSEKQIGTYRILPYLKSRGIPSIDYMIMTHADEDHISGQQELLEASGQGDVSVGCLLLPEPSELLQEEMGYQSMLRLAQTSRVPVRYIHTGDKLVAGELTITCLHPDQGMEAESANAYSTTLQVSWQNRHFLLCGDLEGQGEAQVLERLREANTSVPARYDVLKVAHHGSKNSTPAEFLEQVHPIVSVISCGTSNCYGHPHRELLERLRQSGSKILQTPESGAIRILVHRGQIKQQTYFPSGFQ